MLIRNQTGISLIGSMMAGAISILVLTTTTTLVQNSLKANRLIASQTSIDAMRSLLGLVLKNESTCESALKMGGNAPSFSSGQSRLSLTSIDFNGRHLIAVNQYFGDFKVKEISLTKEGVAPNYIGTIKFSFSKTGSGLGAISAIAPIYINLQLDASDTLISCSENAGAISGFEKVGDFSIEKLPNTPLPSDEAAIECSKKGAQTCSGSQWLQGCYVGVLQDLPGDDEWELISDTSSWDVTHKMIVGDCEDIADPRTCNVLWSKPRWEALKYRCCKN